MRKKTGKIWIAALACIGMMIASVCGLKVSAAENRGTSEPVLEYIVISNPRIDTPGTQTIVAGYQAKDTLTDAVLTYKNTVTDEEMTVSAARIDADTAVFEMNYTDESESGIYSLESLDFEMDEQMYSLDFAKCGIEGKYGVNQSCETEPDAVVEDSDTQEETNDSDVSFTTITKDGEVTENADISDVVEEAVAQRSSDSEIAVYAESGARTTSTGKVIVVLDPGHGGFDPGTSGFGANEKDLTLKIAKYCKAALEKDGRIQVYMTRETDTSVGNTTNVSTDLYNRIQYAIGKKANLFVSIHLNSATASAKGAEVYYPNSNYRADIGAQGKALATDIQNELVKLGLYNRGAKIQNSTSSKYPDNSVQDYYYVIQQSKRAGFPGIIVEHAYLSNQSDYNNYLSSDAKLKKLGEADAKGIITYLDTSGYVGKWVQSGSQWKYQNYDGSYVKNCWKLIKNLWYHFDANGIMQTGFLTLNGKTYYLQSSGAMKTGWQKISNTWYYFDSSGAMVSNGWRWINSKCYYFDKNGKMAVDTWIGEYYVDASGAWVKDKQKETDKWIQSSGRWWYRHGDGTYTRSDWEYIGNKWYYFDQNGWMITGWQKVSGSWYYMESNGARVADGWKWINNKCYYFDKNGKMAADTWIDGSYVDSGHWMYYNTDGSYVKSNWKSVNSIWYYFDQNGWMVTGWMTLSSGKYYLNPTKNSDGVEGAMLKGYKQIDGKWYYLRSGESPEGSLRYEGVTSIMGTSAMGTNKTIVVNKMVKMFQKSGKNYPTQALTKGNAPTIEAFCQIVYDEAVIEGIKPEVVFGQAMNETGYLQFGGDVKIEQFNFAGLGASGGGIAGESFKSVAEGIRAQVQHLKGYASTEALKQTCVDNRYKWVTKGCAPYVEWLGQKENLNGKGWATSKNYGMNLMEKYIIPMYSL